MYISNFLAKRGYKDVRNATGDEQCFDEKKLDEQVDEMKKITMDNDITLIYIFAHGMEGKISNVSQYNCEYGELLDKIQEIKGKKF